LWQRAKAERASPRQIGVAVAIGTFCCFAPILWLHLATALLLSSVLRVNRLWAAAASQLPSLFGLLRAPILFVEIETGHFVRTGGFLDLTPREALKSATHMIFDWLCGSVVVALVLALALGVSAWGWARRRDRLEPTPRAPDELPPPTSESQQ
jgi:uncharacterized protein (DUF2062 family)